MFGVRFPDKYKILCKWHKLNPLGMHELNPFDLKFGFDRDKMVVEVRTQTKASVGVEVLWKALSEDLRFILPKVVPNSVEKVEVVQGNGGIGTVMLFTFGPGVKAMRYQKEKIVELDESRHRIGLQVIEGGYLNLGFSSYSGSFELSGIGEQQTVVDITVSYEAENADTVVMPSDRTKSSVALINNLETYLLSGSS